MKKTRLKITIEQKQMWRISQADDEEFSVVWQTDKPALLKDALIDEVSPREIRTRKWSLKILSAFVRVINYTLHLLGKLKTVDK